MSICCAAWQDNSESATAALLPDNDMFWNHQGGRHQGVGSCPVLVVNPVRAIKGIYVGIVAQRENADQTEFTQAVDQLMQHKHGSIVRGMTFERIPHDGAKRNRHVAWAGVVSDSK